MIPNYTQPSDFAHVSNQARNLATEKTSLLIYQRRGGATGLNDQLIIDAAHQAVLSRQTERVMLLLDPGTVDQIRQQLAQAQFCQLATEYSLPNGQCDHIEYTITYEKHTVRATDIAVPEVLWPVVEQLNQIVEQGRPSPP